VTRLILVRHCESSGQEPEATLTEVGHRQARALLPSLDRVGIDFVVSSPYERALQSIAPFATKHSLTVHQDARFRERELSAVALPDWLDHLERSYRDLDYRHPTGESGRDAQQRAWQAIDEVVDAGHRCPAIVAHGNLIALILRRIDPSIGFEFWRGLSNPDVYQLSRTDGSKWRSERLWSPMLPSESLDRDPLPRS